MRKRTKTFLVNASFNVIFWIGLFMLVLAIRYYDIGNIAFVQMDIHIPPIRIYGNGIILGILIGLPYSLMEVFLKNRGLYKNSLLRIMTSRLAIQFLITATFLTIIAYVNYYLDVRNGAIDEGIGFDRYIFSATVMFLFIGAFIGNVILSVFRTLQQKIGEDVFYQLLLGKYSPAKEEERAFMFLDLKSSTTIAEELGHEKYSFFIQDCFSDLHPAVVKTRAMVYQYVGDEAVLTWDAEMAVTRSNCINAFFEFERQLQSKKEYYAKTYGVVPSFKAGVNIGKVMAAEVGVIKREIAYHSDVLNTAARIQGQCNEKNARLLVSEDVYTKLDSDERFRFTEKGKVLLRGKNDEVRIYEVNETNPEIVAA